MEQSSSKQFHFPELARLPDIYNAPLAGVVGAYLHYWAVGQGSTAKAKRLDLKQLQDFLVAELGTEQLTLADLTPSVIEEWRDSLSWAGHPASFVNRKLATLKHLTRLIAELRPDYLDPARKVRGLDQDATPFQAITFGQFQQLRASVPQVFARPFDQARAVFCLDFLFWTGLRAAEALHLKLRQVDAGVLSGVQCKGGRIRRVIVGEELQRAIDAWLPARAAALEARFPRLRARGTWHELPLIVSLRKADELQPDSFRLSYKSLWRIVHKLGEDIGLKELHPHVLRHSFAFYLLEKSGGDVRLVAQALGHRSLNATLRYTERPEDRIRALLNK